ncbi:hypothetical protein B0T26DRAFT_780825 [Lasiosphaeria miniovina]|uniref:Uncharacterized protein n=1 Tax=Lasiosphaeria miniovina TaxID=1954250 RepID=A0AA40ABT2_9PEZI|nr:uncharacterized protein B0T26DRAFT_780825 [Lasiosphaeria miniovina]KAK0712884.1 hypothetical protein B0T26DRAFT_780825 [Lasiosphaeria miniovina]
MPYLWAIGGFNFVGPPSDEKGGLLIDLGQQQKTETQTIAKQGGNHEVIVLASSHSPDTQRVFQPSPRKSRKVIKLKNSEVVSPNRDTAYPSTATFGSHSGDTRKRKTCAGDALDSESTEEPNSSNEGLFVKGAEFSNEEVPPKKKKKELLGKFKKLTDGRFLDYESRLAEHHEWITTQDLRIGAQEELLAGLKMELEGIKVRVRLVATNQPNSSQRSEDIKAIQEILEELQRRLNGRHLYIRKEVKTVWKDLEQLLANGLQQSFTRLKALDKDTSAQKTRLEVYQKEEQGELIARQEETTKKLRVDLIEMGQYMKRKLSRPKKPS